MNAFTTNPNPVHAIADPFIPSSTKSRRLEYFTLRLSRSLQAQLVIHVQVWISGLLWIHRNYRLSRQLFRCQLCQTYWPTGAAMETPNFWATFVWLYRLSDVRSFCSSAWSTRLHGIVTDFSFDWLSTNRVIVLRSKAPGKVQVSGPYRLLFD